MAIKRIGDILGGGNVERQPSTGEGIIKGLRDAVDGKSKRETRFIRPGAAQGKGDGTSWENAFGTIDGPVIRKLGPIPEGNLDDVGDHHVMPVMDPNEPWPEK